jgi:hypothetical protein
LSYYYGGSVRGYQAIFVPLAAVRSPGYSPLDGQPTVYLYIAALEVIVLNCRESRGYLWSWRLILATALVLGSL